MELDVSPGVFITVEQVIMQVPRRNKKGYNRNLNYCAPKGHQT